MASTLFGNICISSLNRLNLPLHLSSYKVILGAAALVLDSARGYLVVKVSFSIDYKHVSHYAGFIGYVGFFGLFHSGYQHSLSQILNPLRYVLTH